VTLLQVENVTKNFGSLVAVDQVSLSVAEGELRAIIGPNGAGKTTFFNMISGFFAPTRGRIVFAEKDVTGLSAAERVALGMARTFQVTEIFPELSVHGNLQIAVEVAMGYRFRPWLSRAKRRAVSERVDELVGLVGLGSKIDRLVGELSHGDQRANEIGLALALKPRLLLLDEPTAGMGDQETHEATALIQRLHREEHYTIVLIEHDMKVVFGLAEHITVLDRGALLAEGTPAEIGANQKVQAAYLGQPA
jgi:branched-chain amino acid transport system ATP-binding protein